jgi:valyl-tRNA synthetase
VTEEVWSWSPQPDRPGQGESIHRAAWPDGAELRTLAGPDAAVLDAASLAIASIRRAKSQARLPMRAPVRRLTVTAPADLLQALAAVRGDVQAAGRVGAVDLRTAEDADAEPVLEVTL